MPSGHLDRNLKVRVTDAEYERLFADADKLGTSASALLRTLISLPRKTSETAGDNVLEGHELVVFKQAEVRDLARQVRAWGHHYNQAVHALNIIKSKRFMTPEDTIGYMEAAMGLLDEIDASREALEASAEALLAADAALIGKGR